MKRERQKFRSRRGAEARQLEGAARKHVKWPDGIVIDWSALAPADPEERARAEGMEGG